MCDGERLDKVLKIEGSFTFFMNESHFQTVYHQYDMFTRVSSEKSRRLNYQNFHHCAGSFSDDTAWHFRSFPTTIFFVKFVALLE